jgi:hypothetical protein
MAEDCIDDSPGRPGGRGYNPSDSVEVLHTEVHRACNVALHTDRDRLGEVLILFILTPHVSMASSATYGNGRTSLAIYCLLPLCVDSY